MPINVCKMPRNSKLPYIVIILSLLTNASTGQPHKWYDANIAKKNVSHSAFPQKIEVLEYASTQGLILTNNNYEVAVNDENVTSRIDGKIIFPSDDMSIQLQKYIPKPSPNCENLTFCESILNYPNDLVDTALRMNKDLKFYPGVDIVPDVVYRVNAPQEDYALCDSKEMIIYPRAAKNKDKEWIFIINHGEFTQSVRVETCGEENSPCNLVDGFAEGYKTTCKQKYIYRELMSVSISGQIKPEIFRFPVSCCCHVKFTGNPLVRIGVGTTKKTNLQSTSK